MTAEPLTGLVLAAGAGTRFGGPKALARTAEGTPWVALAVDVLRAAGCARVVVVLGADAASARALVPASADVVVAPDWAEGLSASLRAGLRAAEGDVVVIPVDTPGLPVAAVRRVVSSGADLAQAVYRGVPGHPVYLAAAHRLAVAESVSGDRGARAYLTAHGVREIECADLWSGLDVDEA